MADLRNHSTLPERSQAAPGTTFDAMITSALAVTHVEAAVLVRRRQHQERVPRLGCGGNCGAGVRLLLWCGS